MNRQYWVLIATVIGMVAAMGLALWLSNEKGPKIETARRFTAAPGASRKQAFALASKRAGTRNEERPSPRTASASGGADERVVPVRSLVAPEERKLDPFEVKVQSALNMLDAAAGLAELDALLQQQHTAEEAGKVNAARAQLLAQLHPDDAAPATAAYEAAVEAAQTPQARHEATLLLAQFLIQRDETERAAALLEGHKSGGSAPTAAQLRLQLLLGQVYSTEGKDADALHLYQDVIETAAASSVIPAAEREDLLRLGGARLSRHYSLAGQEEQAEAVRRQVQASLAERPAPPQ